jgi:hypothetical protein
MPSGVFFLSALDFRATQGDREGLPSRQKFGACPITLCLLGKGNRTSRETLPGGKTPSRSPCDAIEVREICQ